MDELEKQVLECIGHCGGEAHSAGAYYQTYSLLSPGPEIRDAGQFEEILERLAARGLLRKEEENSLGLPMYALNPDAPSPGKNSRVRTVLEIRGRQFQRAGRQELFHIYQEAVRELARGLSRDGALNSGLLLSAVVVGTAVGAGDKNTLSPTESRMAEESLRTVFGMKADAISAVMGQVRRMSFWDGCRMARDFCRMGDAVGLPLLDMVMSLAYIDGRPDGTYTDTLESVFRDLRLETAGKDPGAWA